MGKTAFMRTFKGEADSDVQEEIAEVKVTVSLSKDVGDGMMGAKLHILYFTR